MVKRFVIIIPLLALFFVFSACANDNGSESNLVVRNISNSGCKGVVASMVSGKATAPDVLGRAERIVCKGTADGILRVTHQDLVANCASKFNASVRLDGNRILLTETSEGEGDRCKCTYDLTTEIGPLQDGDYILVVRMPSGKEVKMDFHFSAELNYTYYVGK